VVDKPRGAVWLYQDFFGSFFYRQKKMNWRIEVIELNYMSSSSSIRLREAILAFFFGRKKRSKNARTDKNSLQEH
jgi:hypothetical protein